MEEVLTLSISGILLVLFLYLYGRIKKWEEETFYVLGFLIRGACLMAGSNISSRDIQTLLINSKNRVWIDIRSMKNPPAQFYLKKKGFLVVGKENLNEIKDFLLLSPDRLFVEGSGFDFNNLNSFLNRNANIILDSSMKESDVLSLVQKGKNRVLIKGEKFSSEQLLNFVTNGAQVILNNSLTTQNIHHFLSCPNKNIYIKAAGFETSELENFLNLGANIILRIEGLTEAEVRHLIDKGKRKVWIDTNDFF